MYGYLSERILWFSSGFAAREPDLLFLRSADRTLVGVLPGLGPAAAIALLLPTTFKSTPVSGVIMLAGIYYGAMYGGSTTSILVNIPGEAASVVTCLDGYQMARRGRAGPALGIAAFGSFIAGTVAVIALTLTGPLLAALPFGSALRSFFALMIVGIMVLTFLSSGSMLKALMMAAVGLTLAGRNGRHQRQVPVHVQCPGPTGRSGACSHCHGALRDRGGDRKP